MLDDDCVYEYQGRVEHPEAFNSKKENNAIS